VSIGREFNLRSRACVFDPAAVAVSPPTHLAPTRHARWAAESDHAHDRRRACEYAELDGNQADTGSLCSCAGT